MNKTQIFFHARKAKRSKREGSLKSEVRSFVHKRMDTYLEGDIFSANPEQLNQPQEETLIMNGGGEVPTKTQKTSFK